MWQGKGTFLKKSMIEASFIQEFMNHWREEGAGGN